MNNVHSFLCCRLFAAMITIVVTTATVLGPIYPCHYTSSDQRLFKCDLCTCVSSPPLFSTANLCLSSSLSSCSDRNSDQQFLRSRIDEIEEETNQQFISQYSLQPKRSFDGPEIEFDHFIFDSSSSSTIFDLEQFCFAGNFSRLTFYRLRSRLTSKTKCSLTTNSLRFLDSILDDHQDYFPWLNNVETIFFYNSTLSMSNLNLTSSVILAFYDVKFLSPPFQLLSLPALVHLTITHSIGFELIGSFPNLAYLDLCSTQMDDQQLIKLLAQIHMPDLTTLILSKNRLTSIPIRHANDFPSSIRYLDLSLNQIKFIDSISLKSFYSLNSLNLSSNSPLEIQSDTFTRVPYLEILDLSHCFILTTMIDELFIPLQKLRHLNLSTNGLNRLPRLPVPYDAYSTVSYDHHLPVLYVDASNNQLDTIDFDMFSSASTQDKYIVSLDMRVNRLKTLQFPPMMPSGTRRRGPLMELNLENNPLECDCTLYENLFHMLQSTTSVSSSSSVQSFNVPLPLPPPFQQQPSGFYPGQYLYPGVVLSPHQQPLPPSLYSRPTNLLNVGRFRRQLNMIPPPPPATLLAQRLVKQARVKLLHLSNLTCVDMLDPSVHRSLVDLNASAAFCSYKHDCPSSCSCCGSSFNYCDCHLHCPTECSCLRSFDLSQNHVNCSYRQLNRFPSTIPYSTTHLNLNHNQINSIDTNPNFTTQLNHLTHLSLAHNRLEYLPNEPFLMMIKIEQIDLSSNKLHTIEPRTFSRMFNLKRLYLHNNPWIPKFYSNQGEFQSNTRLISLTYGNGLACNRSIRSSLMVETPLSAEDCCRNSNSDACQPPINTDKNHLENHGQYSNENNRVVSNSRRILNFMFDGKYRFYIIFGLSLSVFLFVCILVLCCIFVVCRRRRRKQQQQQQTKRASPTQRKLLSNGDAKKTTNHYHKSLQPTSSNTPPTSSSTTAIQKLLISTRQKGLFYEQQENEGDGSGSFTDDEDEYASIPLTVSQQDLAPVIRPQPPVPPLPPPRQQQQQRVILTRPVSHSSSVSTSTTARSIVPIIKRTGSSASKTQQQQPMLAPARSCLQIKLDALVLYSIGDSEYVHGTVGRILEEMYGKRFSFYFIHRDRMLGELDWLIENSCVTILILRKPYHALHDYMKILANCSSIKHFVILVNDDKNNIQIRNGASSLKAREKIARLYRTSDVYEWNSNSTSLIHEQLELFLEQNCGSATYVPY